MSFGPSFVAERRDDVGWLLAAAARPLFVAIRLTASRLPGAAACTRHALLCGRLPHRARGAFRIVVGDHHHWLPHSHDIPTIMPPPPAHARACGGGWLANDYLCTRRTRASAVVSPLYLILDDILFPIYLPAMQRCRTILTAFGLYGISGRPASLKEE